MTIYRKPWPEGFPDVIVHVDEKTRNAHPDYKAAKTGDIPAAIRLVQDLLQQDAIEKIVPLVAEYNASIVPVTAIEKGGYNAIPDAMCDPIADYTYFMASEVNYPFIRVETDGIRQINKVLHTKQSGFWRFVTPAQFDGPIQEGTNYFLVDDHIGHGGTLANLRGYIEHHGGHVIGITTLTASVDARKIRLEKERLDMLRSKHGKELENLWKSTFGYGLDCLTNVEAGYLAGQSDVDTIRRRLADAAENARAAGIRPIEEINED